MNINRIILSSMLSLAAISGWAAESPAGKSVEISASDTLKYTVNRIEAHPGEKIVIVLKNEGMLPKEAMAHDFILLRAGVDPMAYAAAAMTAKADGYMPKSHAAQVLATIPLLGPKESGKIAFIAPSAPGSYAYLCSFPGHCMAGMRGILVVK